MAAKGDSWFGVVIRRFVRWVVKWFYPRIQITGGERIPQTGPILVCANHANSLLDPVLIGIAVRRPVRFLAKAPLFEIPLLGAILRALGMLPAFRGSDDSRQVRKNIESLDVAAQALIEGHAMGIFPEGKSHDAAHVDTVRSGAARIATMAAEGGAKGTQIVPVGINYEYKERFRSCVWVNLGELIDVDEWIARHGGEHRPAMRALTPEIEKRLKSVVVHLDEPKWAPFLSDLEILVPPRRGAPGGKAARIAQRKQIADAINHFTSTDRPRAEKVAAALAAYRSQVHAAGLRIDAPILNRTGIRGALSILWQCFWLLLLFLPALAGTLFHIVPFTIVRAIASRMKSPGRTTVSLTLLAVGLPIYGLWYVIFRAWTLNYFTIWFATVSVSAMPFLGILALAYWRGARRALWSGWHQLKFLFHRKELRQVRAARQDLQQMLTDLEREFATVAPRPEPKLTPTWRIWMQRTLATASIAALFVGVWYVGHWFWTDAVIDRNGGVDLAAIPAASLESRLASDEKSLQAVLEGLQNLESRATALQADFQAGRRTFQSDEDNDAVRQLLLSYINHRTALIRLIWRYQRYGQLDDEQLRLRSFMIGYASAAALYDTSLKFVHQFGSSPQAVARLNEGEPAWNIPSGLYDTVERNLASRSNLKLFEGAHQYYAAHRDRLNPEQLGQDTDYAAFHAAIQRCGATAQKLAPSRWKQENVVATKDLKRLVQSIRYETQSAISTWIGDVKIREPRAGHSLIKPEQLEQLRQLLRPGDILLERRNWFLSNAFLPGYWPHAALYVGTGDDLKRLGLDQDPRVQAFLDEYSKPDDHGRPLVIIEALSEGVVFNSLEHSIGGADSAALLRPQLSQEQINEAIAQAFGNAAKPYDFEFDFTSRDKLVCTEVVFRAYGANTGPLHFPVKQILGRQTMLQGIPNATKMPDATRHTTRIRMLPVSMMVCSTIAK